MFTERAFLSTDLQASFRPAGNGDFTHTLAYGLGKPNPMGRIAEVALHRLVEGAEIQAPLDYDREVLQRELMLYGWYDQPTRVSGTQATEAAYIGNQLLALDEAGMIQPPLAPTESEEISHVVSTVATCIPDWEKIVRVPGVNYPGERATITARER